MASKDINAGGASGGYMYKCPGSQGSSGLKAAGYTEMADAFTQTSDEDRIEKIISLSCFEVLRENGLRSSDSRAITNQILDKSSPLKDLTNNQLSKKYQRSSFHNGSWGDSKPTASLRSRLSKITF